MSVEAAPQGAIEAAPHRERRWLRGWGRPARWVGLWLLVAVLIGVWDREVIDSPPYEDQAVGWWLEADFLADSGFDYYALLYEQEHYMSGQGGARSYMISVLPTLLALVMTTAPDVQTTIVVVHLFGFACAAAILLLMYGVLRPRVGMAMAVAAPLAMATTPLFHTQVKIVGMDVPLTVFSLLAAICVWKRRYVLAAAVSMVAFAMKATGGLVVMATIVFLGLRWLLGGARLSASERRRLRRGLLANALALAAQTAIVAWGDTSVAILWGSDWPNVWSLPYAVAWCPEVVAVFLITAALALWCMVTALRHDAAGDSEAAARRVTARRAAIDSVVPGDGGPGVRLERFLRRDDVLVLSMIVVVGMLAASSLYIFIPRYFTSAMPFLFIAWATAWPRGRKWWPAGWVLLLGLSTLNVVNADGRFYPPIDRVAAGLFEQTASIYARSCPFTERSDEYLDDHRSNQAAIRLLESRYAESPIFACRPLLHYLREPRLGYVRRGLQVVSAETFGSAIRGFVQWAQTGGKRGEWPIFVWSGEARTILPAPQPTDEILYDDGMSPPLIVFRRRVPEQALQTAAAAETWFLDQTWPGPWMGERLQNRVLYLVETDRLQRAIDETLAGQRMAPNDRVIADLLHSLQLRRAAELKGWGHADVAIAEVRQSMQQRPDDARLRRLHSDLIGSLVLEKLERGMAAEALELVYDALRADPGNVALEEMFSDLTDRCAAEAAERHDYQRALRLIDRALARLPDDERLAVLRRQIARSAERYAEWAGRFAIDDEAATEAGDAPSVQKEAAEARALDEAARADRELTEFLVRWTRSRPAELARRFRESDPVGDEALAPGSDYAAAVDALRRGAWESARRRFEAALRAENPPPRRASLIELALAIVLMEQGRLKQAAERLEEALATNPGLTEGLYYLGVIRLQQGQCDRAAELFEQVVERVPRFAAAHDQLAVALARSGKPRRALEHAEEAVRLDPVNRLALLHLRTLKRRAAGPATGP